MATKIQLPACAITKAAGVLAYLDSIIESRPVHSTIKMGISHCKEILGGDNLPEPDRKLAALEFIGDASVLFALEASFKYSNPCQTIFWRHDSYEPYNVQVLSAKLWDQTVDRARAVQIDQITCHLDNHNHNNHETPAEHAEGIEEEIHSSLDEFKTNEGLLRVTKWIETITDDGIDVVNNDCMEFDAVNNITNIELIHDISKKVGTITNIPALSARDTTSTISYSSTDPPSTKASNEISKSKRRTYLHAFFPAGFHTEDKRERPFAGHRLKRSPDPSALPIPSFYQKKSIQKPTMSTHTTAIKESEDLIEFPPSPPLSTTRSEDLIKISSTPITSHHNEPLGRLPTPPASPVYNCSEQHDQLATLEAALFTFASIYLGNSNIRKLDALYDVIENSHLTSPENAHFTDKMIELVHSVTNEHIKNTKAGPTKGDFPDFDALKQIYSIKKSIDILRDYI